MIVGESLSAGTTLITTGGASANLLLTNGTLVQLGENTKLVLNALYQKSFWEVNKKQVSWSLRLVLVVLLWSFKKVTL